MSTQLRAYKYRLYPDVAQTATLAQFFGAKRWIFNHFLNEQKTRFDNKENHLSNFDCNKLITELKKQEDTDWLRGIDDWVLKSSSEDLSVAYKNFFASITGKRKGPKVKPPTFKSKYARQSYRTRSIKVDFENNLITVPKIKNIKCILHRKFNGTIKQATVSKNPDGLYYISILVEETIQLKPMTHREVGIDLGLKDLAILSTGVKFNHPQEMLSRTKKALKRAQRILARKNKGSNSYNKQRLTVAKLYSRLTRMRNEYYHLISRYLIDNFDAIYLEDLNVNGMLKNRRLSRKIHETAWSTLKTMIKYKANYAGKTVHEINRWFPSSKTCSCCGYKLDKLSLDKREWTCLSCGVHHDRDLNAAINILNQGQIDLYDSKQNSSATLELGASPPMALQKHSMKIERSSSKRTGWNGEQASLTVFSC
jgi:putative transposase